ncbi:MAG: hypothetical protein KF782_13820 [Labilithrix sp.]|nr:hypothetical protein [Labilithrix sp.]
MNAIARLLEHAKTVESWPVGTHVERNLPAVDQLRGRVAFVDEGWIYWAAEDGHVHASSLDAVRRIQ